MRARRVVVGVVVLGVLAVGVCFLHSYADPSHELAMREVLRREHPDAVVSLSCEVLREYREYERSVTTLVDAAVKPAMNGYLARIAGQATRTGPPFSPDEHTVLDLVAVLAGGRDTARATAHRAAARCYIEEHLTDPDLGAEEIAAAIGLSERQLSRVFAADGTSVPRHILSRRLELAHAVLAARVPGPAAPGRAGTEETVADIAARCGFTSAAYFSHMFRTRFGFRASDLRRGFSFPPSEGVCLGPGQPG